jgi:hypothetical protein
MAQGASRLASSTTPSRRAVPASGPIAPVVSPTRATAAFARTIRLQCIRRRSPTLDVLAAESGVALGRIHKFVSSDPASVRNPRLDEALSIWAVLGAAAATASLADIGMNAGDDEPGGPSLAEAVAGVLEDATEFARVAATGGITRRNAADIERAADDMIDEARSVRRQARAARG